jgi:hypothetical protein
MEPLSLEYEGCDFYTYSLDLEFTNIGARVNITPEYFVVR